MSGRPIKRTLRHENSPILVFFSNLLAVLVRVPCRIMAIALTYAIQDVYIRYQAWQVSPWVRSD